MITIEILISSFSGEIENAFHQIPIKNLLELQHIIIIHGLCIDMHLSSIIIITSGHQAAIIPILVAIIWPMQSLNWLVISTITYTVSSTFNKLICQQIWNTQWVIL